MSNQLPPKEFDRREFLRICGIASSAFLIPAPLLAAGPRADGADRKIELFNNHTGETLRTTYWADGGYVAEAMHEIDHVLRDHRTGEIHDIDPNLIDLLYALAKRLDQPPRFQIVSGYRSPETNESLRRDNKSVAKKSYHLKGKAVDLRMSGVELAQLRRAARSLKGGGVGWYPRSGFVHVDTGPVRTW